MDITSATITFVTSAYTFYNAIKTIKGLPKEFGETEIRLPLALNTLKEFEKHQSGVIDSGRKAAIEKYLNPCNKSAKKLQSIFESIKQHEGKDGLSRYRIVVLKMGKASRVEVLLRQIIESLHMLALNNEAHMTTLITQLADSIEALKKVESSIPDEDFDENQATTLTQHFGEGGTGYQNSSRFYGGLHANNGGRNYQSGGGPMTIHEADNKTVKRQNEVLSSLDKVAYRAAKDRNRRPVLGTCDWVVQHEVFLDWKNKPSSGLLWLSADPGCGKSVLARHLVDSVLADHRCCYFFFKDGYTGQTTVDSALSCVLHQLLVAHMEVFTEQILCRFEQSSQLYNSTPDLWDILKAIVKDIGSEVICVFDAFDECGSEDARTLATLLRDYYAQPIATCNLKFLVTSRPYDDMKYIFRIDKNISIIQINGETKDEVKKITKEIDIFIKSEINEMQEGRQISPDEATSLQKWLEKVRNRSYLWAYLVLAEIKDRPGARIEMDFSNLPKTVRESYEAILTRTSKRHDRKTVAELLHITLAATRPLSVEETYAALNVQPQYTLITEVGTPRDEFEAHIRDICGLFVCIVDSEVHLFHQTAREFLVARRLTEETVEDNEQRPAHNESEETDFPWEGSFRPTVSNYTLYEKCALYLLLVEKTTYSIDECLETFPLYMYCAENWAKHYCSSQTKDVSLGLLLLNLNGSINNPKPRRWCVAYFKSKLGLIFDETFTPLMAASYFGLHAFVHLVANRNSLVLYDIEPQTRRTALSFAAEKGHTAVVAALIKRRCTSRRRFITSKRHFIDNVCFEGKTPLIYAASCNHLDIVKMLISNGAATNICDSLEESALTYAIMNGYSQVEDALAGSPHVLTEETKKKLLFNASKECRLGVLERLLEAGVNLNVRDRRGFSPLQHMIANKFYDMARMCLDNGADPDYPDSEGYTPFHVCMAYNGHQDAQVWSIILERLPLAKIDDPRTLLHKTDFGMIQDSTLSVAVFALCKAGYDDIARRLLNFSQAPLSVVAGIRVDRKQMNLFSDIVLEWIARADTSARTQEFALYGGHLQDIEVEAMETLGLELETRDKYGRTAIFKAAIRGDASTLRVVIDAGADVNAEDQSKGTPLSHSVLGGKHECMGVLLQKGANIEARDGHQRTPLLNIAAAMTQDGKRSGPVKYIHQYWVTVGILLQNKANVEAKDDKSMSSLEYGVNASDANLVKWLLEGGADANACLSDGRTPLQRLTIGQGGESSDTIRKLLCRHGAE